MDEYDARVRIATVIVLGIVLIAVITGLTVVAVLTDRNDLRGGALLFGVAMIGAAGGVSWWTLHRRWRIRVDHEDGEEKKE